MIILRSDCHQVTAFHWMNANVCWHKNQDQIGLSQRSHHHEKQIIPARCCWVAACSRGLCINGPWLFLSPGFEAIVLAHSKWVSTPLPVNSLSSDVLRTYLVTSVVSQLWRLQVVRALTITNSDFLRFTIIPKLIVKTRLLGSRLIVPSISVINVHRLW